MTRNIVLVTYDSLRADHCGFMGYGRDTTPTLDRFAENGVVFQNAIASGVPTIASMTAVMTGFHSLASPEIGFDTEQREQVTGRPTIAEVLSNAGYSTGGLSPNPPASSYFGFDKGFDWFEDFLAQDQGFTERAWNRVFRRSIRGGRASTYLRLARNVVRREEVLRPWSDYYDDIIAWRRQVEEPYFLWVLLLEPHHPWWPPASHQQWSSRWDTYRSFGHYWEMLNSDWKPGFDVDVRERLINLYDDSIRYGDAFLERLADDLAEDEPVFIVHADHGEEFGEHGRYGHQPHLSEALIHVPLVISGLDTDRRVQRPVGLRDLAATVGDIAGVDHPFPSPSVLEDDDTEPWATSKIFARGSRQLVVRTTKARYELTDAGGELQQLTGSAESNPEFSEIFETLATRHIATEREQRAVSAGAAHLAGEGMI